MGGVARFNTKYFSDHQEPEVSKWKRGWSGLSAAVANRTRTLSGIPKDGEGVLSADGLVRESDEIDMKDDADDNSPNPEAEMTEFPYPSQENTHLPATNTEPKLIYTAAAAYPSSIPSADGEVRIFRGVDQRDQALMISMDKFNESLQSWTQLVEEQVKTLGTSFRAVHESAQHRDDRQRPPSNRSGGGASC